MQVRLILVSSEKVLVKIALEEKSVYKNKYSFPSKHRETESSEQFSQLHLEFI